jgi:hypothetical protein
MKGYELVKVSGEYIKNYNNAPYVRKPYSFYRQETISTYNYRGVEVYVKEILNINLTHKGYMVEGISIKDSSKKLNHTEVRKYIDDLFIRLDEKINDRPMFCEYKMSTEKEDNLYATAIDRMITKRYTPLEKRYILGDLIKKGLSKVDALDFLKFML